MPSNSRRRAVAISTSSDMPVVCAKDLLSASAVRERAQAMLELARAGQLLHFNLHEEALPACVDLVVETCRETYPTLHIPFHARWRHFSAGGIDRWNGLADTASWPDAAARGRFAFDLAIVSVLLDAGAGPGWSYRDSRDGKAYARSEGLAVASLDMFAQGCFSDRSGEPLRADTKALSRLRASDIAQGFQVGADNPLVGLEGRAALLARLGETVAANAPVFGMADTPRPGGLFDYLSHQAGVARRLPAASILEALLMHLGAIWPGRTMLDGYDLGDCWHHPLIGGAGHTAGFVPFHKLSQWLAYSLIEPLQQAGIAIDRIDDLTGLPEYRNGGLFLDTGVLRLRDAADAARAHAVDSVLVVEWRALTVALLDQVAIMVRERLGLDAQALPLAKVLEGGTWAAGRVVARRLRADGGPPLAIVSDGTVF